VLKSADMSELEDRKAFILGQLGQTEKDVLAEMGIGVDDAVERVLYEKIEAEAKLSRKAPLLDLKRLPIEDLMTSELSLMAGAENSDSKYKAELERRLALLGLTQEQVNQFVAIDEAAIQKKDPHIRMEGIGISTYFFANTTIESLPPVDTCMTSELVAIVDDANSAFTRDHHWLSDTAFAAVGMACGRFSKSQYLEEFQRRFDEMGLSQEQRGLFIRNECLISEREKWGYNPSQRSWDSASFSK
jgi:hypothetical protein